MERQLCQQDAADGFVDAAFGEAAALQSFQESVVNGLFMSVFMADEDEVGSGLPEGHLCMVDPENRGRRIYRECQDVKDVKLNGHEPPNGFIKGAYENLADDAKDCRVFWHPFGEKHFFPDRPAEGEEF